jgi:hypothetical protein
MYKTIGQIMLMNYPKQKKGALIHPFLVINPIMNERFKNPIISRHHSCLKILKALINCTQNPIMKKPSSLKVNETIIVYLIAVALLTSVMVLAFVS